MKFTCVLALGAAVGFAATANASFLIEPYDIDGTEPPGTGSANFSLGGDTTAVSGPSTDSSAVGTTSTGSIFGGNGGALPDTYLYTYTPGIDGDNVSIPGGTALNDDGNFASGLTAGSSGTYNVYATWPHTTNVSGGDTLYELTDAGGTLFSVLIDQNDDITAGAPNPPGEDGNFKGNEWEFLGTVTLDANTTYTLSQSPSASNSFVSMRADGVLFELVPEPTSALLALMGAAVLAARRR